MTQRVIATPQWGGGWYGYGLITAEADGHVHMGHGGITTGFTSAMIADLDAGLGIVVSINGYAQSFSAVDVAMHSLGILRAGLGQEGFPTLPAVNDPALVDNAEDYAGTYSSGEDRLILNARDGQLILQWQGKEIVLQQRGSDTFYVPHPELEHFLLEFAKGRRPCRGGVPRSLLVCRRGIFRPHALQSSRGMGGIHRSLPHVQFRSNQLPRGDSQGGVAAGLPAWRA